MPVSRHRPHHYCSVHARLPSTERLRETNGKSIDGDFGCQLLEGKPEPSREGRCPGCHCAVEGPRSLVSLHLLEARNWTEPELLDSIEFSDFSDNCSIFMHHLDHWLPICLELAFLTWKVFSYLFLFIFKNLVYLFSHIYFKREILCYYLPFSEPNHFGTFLASISFMHLFT